jgi:flagellar motor switch protein FliN/FliY
MSDLSDDTATLDDVEELAKTPGPADKDESPPPKKVETESLAEEPAFDPEAAFAEAAGELEAADSSADTGEAVADGFSAGEVIEEEAEEEDPWAAALAEQEASAPAQQEAPEPPPSPKDVRDGSGQVFRPLEHSEPPGETRELDIIMNIPVKLNVELGRTKISIRKLLELTQGSVLELDGLAGDPMDILINGYLIAQGEVVVVEDKYGIRITDIITPSERVQKLNR